MRTASSLMAASVLALAVPSIALAGTGYVVDAHNADGTPKAVLEMQVTRVDPAGPDLIDRNPIGYEMTVTRVLRGIAAASTFEVTRSDGCDTMNLALGDRLVVAIGEGDAAPDNYTSAWYELLEGGRLRLVPGSSWGGGLPATTSVAALLQAIDLLPATDAALPEPDRRDSSTILLLIVSLVGSLLAVRRLRHRLAADQS